MTIIDPSPTQEELENLETALTAVATSLSAYLRTAVGRADPNFIPLTTAALDIYAETDKISDAQLQLAVQSGGQAVDVINNATAQLQEAITTRNEITKVLGIMQGVAAFAAAIALGNVSGIISSGQSLITALRSCGGAASGAAPAAATAG
jgi:hypothetical protein